MFTLLTNDDYLHKTCTDTRNIHHTSEATQTMAPTPLSRTSPPLPTTPHNRVLHDPNSAKCYKTKRQNALVQLQPTYLHRYFRFQVPSATEGQDFDVPIPLKDVPQSIKLLLRRRCLKSKPHLERMHERNLRLAQTRRDGLLIRRMEHFCLKLHTAGPLALGTKPISIAGSTTSLGTLFAIEDAVARFLWSILQEKGEALPDWRKLEAGLRPLRFDMVYKLGTLRSKGRLRREIGVGCGEREKLPGGGQEDGGKKAKTVRFASVAMVRIIPPAGPKRTSIGRILPSDEDKVVDGAILLMKPFQ